MGYYETIAGGAGAGPHWHGRSGVHTHMTNTRITDPEIFERRFPIVLHEFSLREGSGGEGKHRGGDGVVREVTQPLSNHRQAEAKVENIGHMHWPTLHTRLLDDVKSAIYT